MPARLRLQRKGKKRTPLYHIVAADGRSTRDGKYIERLGFYNPNTNPATIELNREKALEWLNNGAQPSDTMRAILQYTGVMYQKHLQGGVRKGALSQEQADEKLNAWLTEKETKIAAKRESLLSDISQKEKATLENERKVKEERAAKLLAKNSALAVAVSEETSKEDTVASEGTDAPAVDTQSETPTDVSPYPTNENAIATTETPVEEPKAAAESSPASEEPKAAAESTPTSEETKSAPEAEANEGDQNKDE